MLFKALHHIAITAGSWGTRSQNVGSEQDISGSSNKHPQEVTNIALSTSTPIMLALSQDGCPFVIIATEEGIALKHAGLEESMTGKLPTTPIQAKGKLDVTIARLITQ